MIDTRPGPEAGTEAKPGPDLVTIEAIQAAALRIRGAVRRTPLLGPIESPGPVSGRVWLKCENLQVGGAFKARGAHNFIARLHPEERSRGVVTYSSGNHACGVALAARRFGVPARVVMPVDAPDLKVQVVRALGAEIEQVGTTTVERKRRAEEVLRESGGTMVPPFDHPDIIAGQGTVGLEILEQYAARVAGEAEGDEPALIVVPIGGGGLISGVAGAARGRAHSTRVVGVEPEGAAKMSRSLEAGRPVTLETVDTIADGLKPVRPGDLTYAHCRALVDAVVTVPDGPIREAVLWCLRQGLVVEPSGAAPVAAVATGAVRIPEDRDTVVVLSGGNLDPRLLKGWLDAEGVRE